MAIFVERNHAFSQTSPGDADESKESFVIERFATDVVFAADGTGRHEQSVRVRMQSNAALQLFGIVTIPYRNAFDKVEIVDIHVTKPDGAVVTTPEADGQDISLTGPLFAPAYSDSRAKQIPVKGLGVGDILEWRVRIIHSSADIPGQFWYTHVFMKTGIVLDETLTVTVPIGKSVKVGSPEVKPAIREENSQTIYSWKTSHRQTSKDDILKLLREKARPSVLITSFRNWEEVGRWYGDLQRPKTEVTPAIHAKAAELTRGLNTAAEKQRAIYQFVATKFRYISVSFGQGRYQPHSADEVLGNQYGDCKDKHTLLTALLSAVGIEAWPVLIGMGIDFDQDVPTPAQFNHLITYIPGNGAAIWLDSTPGVAPFGVLQPLLRDKKALVIPVSGAPHIATTPESLPFAADESIEVKAKLSDDGTLTGHIDFTIRGDAEILLRAAFQATAAAQWPQVAQNVSRGMGFAGTLTNVSLDDPSNTDRPLHYSYDYERKSYPGWANGRINAPLPGFGVGAISGSEQPKEPAVLGPLGKIVYRCAIQLPELYSIGLPINLKLQSDFADYTSSYSFDKGILLVERVLTRKRTKAPVSAWQDYQKFAKAVEADENLFIRLTRSSGAVTVERNNDEAARLVQRASALVQNREFNAARDLLVQAERLNDRQLGLWATYGYYYGLQNQHDKATESMRREIEYHPETGVYRTMAAAQKRHGQSADSLQTLRLWVKASPGNVEATLALTTELMDARQFAEAIQPLEAGVKSNPDNMHLQVQLLEAQWRGGKKEESAALLAKFRNQKLDAGSQASIAYVLADTNSELAAALELAEKSVAALQDQSKDTVLLDVRTEDRDRASLFGAAWDALGWVYFRKGDLITAERYLSAAWLMLQRAEFADHLGQLYERQGKKAEAIHSYRLALAARGDLPETRNRLELLGGVPKEPVVPRRGPPPLTISPEEELSRMRSSPVPGLSETQGSAEFYVLFSPKGPVQARFVNGDEKLQSALTELAKIPYNVSFPDEGLERIVRRGILSCSQYTTPHCNFVLLLPDSTRPQ